MGVALWSSQNSLAQALEHRIVLIGDSTMAPNNGYGQALCERLNGLAECWNLAQNGRSTKSFRAEGLWVPREAMALHSPQGRNFVAGTGTLGGMLVATQNLGTEFIELLRNRAKVA
ncbi:MAG: hypothetical protein RL442_2851, partial [Pseudomonadota bacterium]